MWTGSPLSQTGSRLCGNEIPLTVVLFGSPVEFHLACESASGKLAVSSLAGKSPVQDTHEPRLKVKDENVGWKHTCSGCSHAGFERIGSRSGYNPVQDIYILQRPSSCDPHF